MIHSLCHNAICRHLTLCLTLMLLALGGNLSQLHAQDEDEPIEVAVVVPKNASNRMLFGAEQLKASLKKNGFKVSDDRKTASRVIVLDVMKNIKGEAKEGFTITTSGKVTTVKGNDGSGVIYGCRELIDHHIAHAELDFPASLSDAPEMELRGTCVGIQKLQLLPGRKMYDYPFTEQNFIWFYDKKMWIEYLDMMVDNRLNTLYLWNGHPFASLVKLDDYPFAVEVGEEQFQKNVDTYTFIAQEADRRGIKLVQMFYNIIVSKPFADHYGILTADINRPITPLISDYSRKSIAAFIAKYPNVGLLVCLGGYIRSIPEGVDWLTETIIPGIKDGMAQAGLKEEPLLILRSNHTDIAMAINAARPLYNNLYTMDKYNGESLATTQPRGAWQRKHQDMAALGVPHVTNVHILANLEPWRWGSPSFVQKTVGAMRDLYGSKGIHIYPQSGYWEFPYTADKIDDSGVERLMQADRDWMWYKSWGRYAWRQGREFDDEVRYWDNEIADHFGIKNNTQSALPVDAVADLIRVAYQESGEISPMLLRRFGLTLGNTQTLLLGMTMSQLVCPENHQVEDPNFRENIGPEGETLPEWVEKEWKKLPHLSGEMPLDVCEQVCEHADRAKAAIDRVISGTAKPSDELKRLQNDVHCYREFAYAFVCKVRAARHVLNYKWGQQLRELHSAQLGMQQSLAHWRKLADLTRETYFYANSMQTSQRIIPVSGDDAEYKHWDEVLDVYEEEFENFKKNLQILEDRDLLGAKQADRLHGNKAEIAAETGVEFEEDKNKSIDWLFMK